MNDSSHYTGHGDVDHLIHAVNRLNLEFNVQPDTVSLPESFCVAAITGNLGDFLCLVDDEYEDITGHNHPRALQAVLLTILDYEDEKSDEIWFSKNGFSDGGESPKSFLLGLKDFWQCYQKNVENPTRIVSPLSWQLSSDDAAILRSLPDV